MCPIYMVMCTGVRMTQYIYLPHSMAQTLPSGFNMAQRIGGTSRLGVVLNDRTRYGGGRVVSIVNKNFLLSNCLRNLVSTEFVDEKVLRSGTLV